MMKLVYIIVVSVSIPWMAKGQYAPAAGKNGSTAIHKDSSIFTGWASHCLVERGYIKISDTALTFEGHHRAMHGTPKNATGKADGKVVSLGDSGVATIMLEKALMDGNGPDFAIFENGFQAQGPQQQYFLELAFVEVSSDGQRFVRFPAVSNTPVANQVGAFGQIDPTHIYNLAGKYENRYGTPFDLKELQDSSAIDILHITHIKIIDVIGTVDPLHASYDAQGNMINDPWPTPFPSGGFDLDAIGFIHSQQLQPTQTVPSVPAIYDVYPNPVPSGHELTLTLEQPKILSANIEIVLRDVSGKTVFKKSLERQHKVILSIPGLKPGLYFIELTNVKKVTLQKLIITK